MKLLIPSGLFYPSKLGGPANTYYWLAKAFVSKGTDVTVVATNNHIDKGTVEYDKWIELEGIKVRYCTSNSKFRFRFLWQSLKEIRKTDSVLIGSLFFLPNLVIAFFALLFKKTLIWSARGELFDTAINKSKSKLYYIKLLKSLYANKVVFHATSEFEEEVIKKCFGRDIKTIVLPNYMILPEKENKENKDKYFFYAGRLSPIKALDNLFNALLQNEMFLNSEFKLLLAGMEQNGYRSVLDKIVNKDKRLKERIVFLGNLNTDELPRYYANAYFTFLVSHSENFGNVVIESLAQGTPVIASLGTPWKILETSNSGFWINNNPESISSTIDKVLKLRESDYNEYRNNAEKLASNFDVYENIDKWIEVIKQNI